MFRTEPIIWPPNLFSCIPVLMDTRCLSQKFWKAQATISLTLNSISNYSPKFYTLFLLDSPGICPILSVFPGTTSKSGFVHLMMSNLNPWRQSYPFQYISYSNRPPPTAVWWQSVNCLSLAHKGIRSLQQKLAKVHNFVRLTFVLLWFWYSFIFSEGSEALLWMLWHKFISLGIYDQ